MLQLNEFFKQTYNEVHVGLNMQCICISRLNINYGRFDFVFLSIIIFRRKNLFNKIEKHEFMNFNSFLLVKNYFILFIPRK